MSSYQSSLDRLMGAVGVVVESIPSDLRGRGVVKIAGQLWSCTSDWPACIEAGTLVTVVGRHGLVLQVVPRE
jgi:membrane protein implicated in regulation of membrane protease activity